MGILTSNYPKSKMDGYCSYILRRCGNFFKISNFNRSTVSPRKRVDREVHTGCLGTT